MPIYLSFQLSMSIFLQKTFWSDCLQLFAKYHDILSLNFHFFIFPPSISPLMKVHLVGQFLQMYFVPLNQQNSPNILIALKSVCLEDTVSLFFNYKAFAGCALYASTIIVSRGFKSIKTIIQLQPHVQELTIQLDSQDIFI